MHFSGLFLFYLRFSQSIFSFLKKYSRRQIYSVLLRLNSFHKLYYFVLIGHCGYGSLLCGAERTAGVGEHCHFKDIVAVKLLGGFAKLKELVEKCSEEAVA